MRSGKEGSAAFMISAVVTVFLTGLIIIAHEISGELRQSLAGLTGHHWTSVSLLAAAIFLLSSVLFYTLAGRERPSQALKMDSLWAWSMILIALTLLMSLASLAVYVIHYLEG